MIRQRKPLNRSTKPIARRTRVKQKRTTPRRSGRVENPAYLAAVRLLPCHSCKHPAPSDPDHMGPHPHGRKADDDTAVPMCRLCHNARTDGKLMHSEMDEKGRISRFMSLVSNECMAEFRKAAIAATRKTLGWGERVGGANNLAMDLL